MNMKYTAPMVSVVILVGSTISASADIDRCTEIENSLDRLACYDDEAGYNPEVREGVTGSGNWLVRMETSQLDDSQNVFLTLYSEEQTNCPYKSGNHSIHMACRENETNLWIHFGECFMSSIQGKGQVTYRLDTEQAATRDFRESNNNMALGLWSGGTAIPFIKKMIGHDQMIIRATPFSDSTVTGEYDIVGLEEAVQPLRDACNW
jgi:type VI secretion system protein VasI